MEEQVENKPGGTGYVWSCSYLNLNRFNWKRLLTQEVVMTVLIAEFKKNSHEQKRNHEHDRNLVVGSWSSRAQSSSLPACVHSDQPRTPSSQQAGERVTAGAMAPCGASLQTVSAHPKTPVHTHTSVTAQLVYQTKVCGSVQTHNMGTDITGFKRCTHWWLTLTLELQTASVKSAASLPMGVD